MSPEDRARVLLGMDPRDGIGDGLHDEPIDLAEAVDLFAQEMDVDRIEVARELADRLLKSVQVARLRRLTGVYVEE
jgi:hypothetical protein